MRIVDEQTAEVITVYLFVATLPYMNNKSKWYRCSTEAGTAIRNKTVPVAAIKDHHRFMG
jgi:hypothetical protein